MRSRLEHRLNQIWYGGQEAPAWLKALSPLYRAGFVLHRALQSARRPADLKQRAILVIGNLTAGGSGKTPLVISLCQTLRQAGLHPGVVSRGYGRSRSRLIRVQRHSDPREVGDEPLVIAQRAGVPVVVASDRCAASRQLFQQGIDVVIADDGLQHHRLPRQLEICVVDGDREFGNGLLLPAGPLREPLSRLQSVDLVVINGNETLECGFEPAVPMQLLPGLLHALHGEETWRLTQFRGCRVNAVAGIAHPQRFFRTLEQAGLNVDGHVFPDHHAYRQADFASLEGGLPIIMTEKDAVKCRQLQLDNAWYLAVEASLPAAVEADLLARIAPRIGVKRNTDG